MDLGYASVYDLQDAIYSYLVQHNMRPKPFVWSKTAEDTRAEGCGLWPRLHVSTPMPCLPGNAEFAEDIGLILALCRVRGPQAMTGDDGGAVGSTAQGHRQHRQRAPRHGKYPGTDR